jgi:pSer/pThr/pTyr-binding forkhead associated (FHA) protein
MAGDKTQANKKSLSPDWLVRGVLTKLGDTFDKFTGRDWKPTSSLATSELIERLKKLLDSEAKHSDGIGRFVPHNIKLKMQWDKFSTDSEDALKKLENELLTAAIDHINDNRYHTYAPLKIQIKTDYFTEGVKLHASFDEFAKDEPDGELKVTIPDMKVGDFMPVVSEPEPETEIVLSEFVVNDQQKSVELKFTTGERLSVGRTKENDLSIDEESVSKNHATLMINAEGKFLIADTGSTNGTFIGNERLAYGRAFEINEMDKVKIGHVEVFFRRTPKATNFVTEDFAADEDETKVRQRGNQPTGHLETDAFKSEITQTENQTVEARKSENRPLRENYSTQNNLNQNNTVEIRQTEEAVIRPTETGGKFDFLDKEKE